MSFDDSGEVYNEITSPTVNDDYSGDFVEGDKWRNTVTDETFTLFDGTIGAAVWSASGGLTPLFPPAFLYNTEQIVQTLADFPTPIGRDIFLENKTYIIDAIKLDITGYTLHYNEFTAIAGVNQNVNSLYSSEDNVTLIKSTYNLFMNALEIYLDGDNQTVWDNRGTTTFESFELNQVVVYSGGSPLATGTNSKMGYIESIRQGFMGTMFFWGVHDGFECAKHWVGGGLRISNTLWLMCTGKFYYSSVSDPVVFETRFSSNANVNVPLGSIGYDFPETAFTYDGQYQLQSGNASGAGVIVTEWNGKSPAYNTRANFRNNNGIQNTYIGGEWKLTFATTTTINTQNVWTPLNLATAEFDLAWFSESNGVFTYLSDTPLDFTSINAITMTGKSGDIIELMARRVEFIGGIETDLQEAQLTIKGTLNQGRSTATPLNTTGKLVKGDQLRIDVRNTSGNQDVTSMPGTNGILGSK
jgi:hypothetical protein